MPLKLEHTHHRCFGLTYPTLHRLHALSLIAWERDLFARLLPCSGCFVCLRIFQLHLDRSGFALPRTNRLPIL